MNGFIFRCGAIGSKFFAARQFDTSLLLAVSMSFLAFPQSAFAQNSSINLNWAMQQTLLHNPQLAQYPYQLRISDGDLIQAQQRPLPTLAMSAENIFGQDEFTATDSAEFTLTLGQTIELGGKRDSRVAYATASTARKQSEYEQMRLDVLAETGRRYYQLLRSQSLQGWIERRVASELQALEVVQKRTKAGAAGKADSSKMQLRLSRSKALAMQISGQLRLARSALAAMWAAKPSFVTVSGELLQLPSLPTAVDITGLIAESPALNLQQSMMRLADAQVQLAKANSKVDLDVNVGLRRFQATGDQALVFNVSMPIPIANPNRGRISAANAARELSQLQLEQIRRQLQLSFLAVQQTLENYSQYAQVISQELLPQARQLLADTEAGYSLGRYSVLQWSDAQAEKFALERELIDTHQQIYLQLLELERVTGQSLSGKLMPSTY